MNTIIIIVFMISQLVTGAAYGEVIESGWHVVGASVEPGYYFIQASGGRNINDGSVSDVSMVFQPPNPENNDAPLCSVVVYSDYWTESRGWGISGGWGIFKVRQGDYAIYTNCPMIKVPKNYDPRTPFTQPLLSG